MSTTKYIFVTGGVASSLGKGIIASSLAKLLQAVNTGRWDGWVYSTIEGGQAFYRQASQKTFLTVRPKAGAQTPAGTRSWIWALVAIAAVIVVVTALLLRRRGRGRVEEAE